MTPGTLGLRHLEHPRQPWVVHASGTLPRGAACGGDGAWGGCPALASDRGQCALASAPSWTPARRGLGAGQDRGPPTHIGVPPPRRAARGEGARGPGRRGRARGRLDGFSWARRPADPPARTPARPRARRPRGVLVSLISSVFIKKTSGTKIPPKAAKGQCPKTRAPRQQQGTLARPPSVPAGGRCGPPHCPGRVLQRLWPRGKGGGDPGDARCAASGASASAAGVGLGNLEGSWGDSKRGTASGEGGPRPGRRSLRGGVAATAGVWGIWGVSARVRTVPPWGPRAQGRTGAGRRAGRNRGLRIGKAILGDNRQSWTVVANPASGNTTFGRKRDLAC